jgi:putative flippase GtrA
MPSVDLPGPASSTRQALPPATVQFLWFLFVGGAGAIGFVTLSALAIGLRTGVPDWLVSALCYAAMIAPVYLAHRRLSFRSEVPHGRALPRYLLVQLGGLSLAATFSYLAYGVLAMPTIAAAALVTALTAGVNFLVLRLWAFADAMDRQHDAAGSI